jgi:hypothetical protein
LISLANSKLLRQNALQPRARHRSRALVDHSIAAAADSFHDLRAISYLLTRAEIRLQNQSGSL